MPPRFSALSDAQRAIESEIDAQHLDNPLLGTKTPVALLALLNVVQDLSLPAGDETDYGAFAGSWSSIMAGLQHAMLWVLHGTSSNDPRSAAADAHTWHAAAALLALGSKYEHFVRLFTPAHQGILSFEVRGDQLVPHEDAQQQGALLAYLALLRPENRTDFGEELASLRKRIGDDTRLVGTAIHVGRSAEHAQDAMALARRAVAHFSYLPGNWHFSRYMLDDYRQVYAALKALAIVAQYAWEALDDDERAAVGSGITLEDARALTARVTALSGVPEDRAHAVLDDLTYGHRGQRRPDPSLQPLIPFDGGVIVFVPSILMHADAERNFTVLANRVDAERRIYDELKDSKEEEMRNAMLHELPAGLRPWSGRLPGRPDLPDIDLALIDDARQCALVTELKWFIAPAEAGETLHRTQDLRKACAQLLALREADNSAALIRQALGVKAGFRLSYCVISANWIGEADAQDPIIPIVQQLHVMRKLTRSGDLHATADWLESRAYLPIEGTDFRVRPAAHHRVGRWLLAWPPRVELLAAEQFLERSTA